MRARLPIVEPLERALFLRSLDLLRDVPAHQLTILAQLMREQWVTRGAVLQEVEERVREVRLMVEGGVVYTPASIPSPALEGRGSQSPAPIAVGLVEALAQEKTRRRAVAETNALALVIDTAALFDVLEDHFALVLALRAALAREVSSRGGIQRESPAPRLQPSPTSGEPSPDSIAAAAAAPELVQQLIHLHRAPQLRPFGVGVLASLARAGRELRAGAGEALWQRGDAARFFVLVQEGSVKEEESGLRAGPGAILALEEAFCPAPYGATVVAETDVVALRIDAAALLDVAEDHFHVASGVLAFGARQLLRLEHALPRAAGEAQRVGANAAAARIGIQS